MAQKEGRALRENHEEWVRAFEQLGERLGINTATLPLGEFALQKAS